MLQNIAQPGETPNYKMIRAFTGTNTITLSETQNNYVNIQLEKIQENLEQEQGEEQEQEQEQNTGLSSKLVDLSTRTLQVGDLILKSNKVLPYDASYTTEEWNGFTQKTDAVAIIFREADEEKGLSALGVGLKESELDISWTLNENVYDNSIDAIKCWLMKDGSTQSTGGTWTENHYWSEDSDIDGNDNWQKICDFESSASTTTYEYPIFEYALEYGTEILDLTETLELGKNWYVPSIAELIELFLAKETVNSVIQKLGNNFDVLREESDTTYWSSSQDAYDATKAMVLWFDDGYIIKMGKDSNGQRTRVVHKF